MKQIMFRTFFSSMLLLLVASCGGGGSSTPDTTTPDTPANTSNATLVVNVAGLPSSATADIVITKGTFTKNVSATETISSLDDGVYTVTANNVTDNSLTYIPDTASQSVTLTNNQTTTITITYTQQAPAPQAKVVSAQGAITGFGSVVVNGIHFLTTDTQVSTDDTASTDESSLKLGMVVNINGTVDEATGEISANQIDYSAEAEGMIESINLVNKSFDVMGQTIIVDSLTEFEGVTFNSLQVGQSVEISGNRNASDQIVATRVEVSGTTETQRKLRGIMSNFDQTNAKFNINNIVVDFSAAQVEGTLADGAEVKVSANQDTTNSSLMADEVKVLNNHDNNNGSEQDEDRAIDGIITQFVSGTDFNVDDQAISTDGATEYSYGQASDLAQGLNVSVYGTINANNTLVASKIRFDSEGDTEFKGMVESVNADTRQVTIMGTTIQTDLNTKFKDESSAQVRNFDLSFVNINDRLSIEAFVSSTDNMAIARKVSRKGDNNTQGEALRGKVSEITQPQFVVNNVTVKTSVATDFEAGDNQGLTQAQFFTQLAVDMNVKVKGSLDANGVMLAASVEIKASEQDNEQNNRTELQGVVTTFVSATEFSVNNHAVTTTNQTEYKHGTVANLALDAAVEIKGEMNADNIIVAMRVNFENNNSGGDNGDNGDNRDVEFTGMVNSFVSATDFIVGDQAITTDSSTQFENGTIDQLANDVRIQVEGSLLDTGIVLAKKIEFKTNGDGNDNGGQQGMEISGNIKNFNSVTDFFVDTQAVTTDTNTEYKNGNADQLANDVAVTVKGMVSDQNVLLATKIEFDGQSGG